MRILKTILFRAIGLVLFLYLILRVVDLQELARVLRSIDRSVLFWIIPLHLLQWTLRVLRWQILLRNEGIAISFHENYAVATAGFFLGCLTPGRVGEFGKVKFLMNAGYPFRGAFLSSLWERVLDVAALFCYVILGSAVCFPLLKTIAWTYAPSAVLFFVGILVIYTFRSHWLAIFSRLIPGTLADTIEQKWKLCRESILTITYRQWNWITFYSIAVWGLNYWMIYLLFHTTQFPLSILHAFAFAAFGSLAGLLPISIYGVGIREAILIALFALLGYAKEDAATAGVLFGLMFMVLLVYHILLGFVWWMSPAMQRFIVKKP